jgi:TonB-linked SusC/RagA family outer membrane protein
MKTPRLKFPGVITRMAMIILIQLLCYHLTNAQSPVSGVVKDETGGPLPSVIIQLKGKSVTTTTDVNGKFTISAASSDVLLFRFMGYQAKEVKVGNQTTLNISLRPDSKDLSEIIVTGYSKQSKHDLTGAASTISASVIQQTPVTSVEGAIQGRVAGVTVDGQGGPGNSQTIRIRGVGNFDNNDPLYVIDGVQIRIGTSGNSQDISNLLNPNDIESLTILKDPSLTTLYGANGSNGVIVITTKSGKMGAPKLEYSGYVGVENPRNLPKTITPQQQANALYQSFVNAGASPSSGFVSLFGSGTTPVLPDYIIETATSAFGVPAGDARANASLYNQTNYRIIQTNKAGTDWWNALFSPALTQNHNLSLSGATDKSTYAVTLGYLNDQGTLLNTYFQRYSLRVNTTFKIKPWLRFGENLEASFSSQSTESRGATNDISQLYILSPLLPKYDIAGNPVGTHGLSVIGLSGNPYTSRVNALADKSYNQSIVGSAYGEADIIKGLTYTNQIGFKFFPNEYHGYTPVQPQEPLPLDANIFTEGGSYATDWRWLNKLAYTTTINGIHNISAFAGYEVQEYAQRFYGSTVTNILYPSTNTEYLGNGTNLPGMGSGGGTKTTDISYFANVTYSLMDKYLLTGTVRRDETSGLAIQGQNFGAASVGWRISKESFLSDVTWLNDLKLRASYGESGNNASLESGQYLTTLQTGPFGNYDLGGTNTTSMNGYFIYQLGNAALHWEVNKSDNLGFDATLFHNSLTVGFSWYNRKTIGAIFAPPSSGTEGSALSAYQNVLNFTNKGIELELSYNSHIGDVKYDMGFNITTNTNRVTHINGISGTPIPGGVYGSNGANYLTRSEVGQPVSTFYGFEYQGLYKTKADVDNHATESSVGITPDNALGNAMYKDINGDGKIDDNDKVYLGSPIPKFTYGYSVNFSYKSFDVGIFFQGSYGNKIYDYARVLAEFPNGNGQGLGGLSPAALNTWSPSNTNGTLPIFAQNSTVTNPLPPSSFFVESGSYLRLKTATLGYTLPKIKGINKLRVYVQAFNLLTITKYTGTDPEVNDGNPHDLGIDYGTAYPISQKFLFGVNMSL